MLREPELFVFQTGLNEFFVTYELNTDTDRPNESLLPLNRYLAVDEVLCDYGAQRTRGRRPLINQLECL